MPASAKRKGEAAGQGETPRPAMVVIVVPPTQAARIGGR